MKLELVPISPGDERRAWEIFKESSMKHVLHNELVRKILALRDQLEVAAGDKVVTIQSDLKAHRLLFGLIHRNDSLLTK